MSYRSQPRDPRLNHGENDRRPYTYHNDKAAKNHDRIVNSMTQLTYMEKIKVKEHFRQGCAKGFLITSMSEYIYKTCKIQITFHFAQSLKKMQIEENRWWFYELAEDSNAYLCIYRDALDVLKQLEQEMWLIILNPTADFNARVLATKEMHSLTKSRLLIAKELPFITSLAKQYDLPPSFSPDNHDMIRKTMQYPPEGQHYKDREYGHLTKDVFDSVNSSLVHQIVNNLANKPRLEDRIKPKVDADVIDTMKDQLKTFGYPTTEEDVKNDMEERKAVEERYIKQNLSKLDEELGNVDSEDAAKVVKLGQDYRKTMAYFDSLVTPEHREAIQRLNEIRPPNKQVNDSLETEEDEKKDGSG